MDYPSLAAGGAETIQRAFDEHHREMRGVSRRVRRRFEERDWEGIRRDTLEKQEMPSRSVDATIEILRERLGGRLADRQIWAAMKEAYAQAILGRDDFEIAQTYFNSTTASIPRSISPRTSFRCRFRIGRWRAPACMRSTGSTRR
jgi:isocitrate dehydrogenase kinase/phosphatase